ncbi:nucleotidyltransferase family protein [Patescibacteria group bacterium]|nr:nucleotidyltransferase family protein [Patescibacteria group bacterium]
MTNQYLHDQTNSILFSYGVKKAAVFGSYARGSQTDESDIDILVELGKKMSLLDFVGLKLDLEDKLNKKVDLLQYKTLKPSIKDFILKDQLVFYQA